MAYHLLCCFLHVFLFLLLRLVAAAQPPVASLVRPWAWRGTRRKWDVCGWCCARCCSFVEQQCSSIPACAA